MTDKRFFEAVMDAQASDAIAAGSHQVSFSRGATLMRQGDLGSSMFRKAYVIVDGTCTVSRNGKKVATLGPGDVVGELSLLDHGPRTATVTADTPMTVLVLDQRHFIAVLDDVPALSHKLLANLAGRIREFDRKNYG